MKAHHSRLAIYLLVLVFVAWSPKVTRADDDDEVGAFDLDRMVKGNVTRDADDEDEAPRRRSTAAKAKSRTKAKAKKSTHDDDEDEDEMVVSDDDEDAKPVKRSTRRRTVEEEDEDAPRSSSEFARLAAKWQHRDRDEKGPRTPQFTNALHSWGLRCAQAHAKVPGFIHFAQFQSREPQENEPWTTVKLHDDPDLSWDDYSKKQRSADIVRAMFNRQTTYDATEYARHKRIATPMVDEAEEEFASFFKRNGNGWKFNAKGERDFVQRDIAKTRRSGSTKVYYGDILDRDGEVVGEKYIELASYGYDESQKGYHTKKESDVEKYGEQGWMIKMTIKREGEKPEVTYCI